MSPWPIALLNSLRFGNLESNKTKRLLRGVVQGIGHYSIATIDGKRFHDIRKIKNLYATSLEKITH